jgi:outer membrane protein TolC
MVLKWQRIGKGNALCRAFIFWFFALAGNLAPVEAAEAFLRVPLSLQEAEQRALQQNLQVQALRQKVQASRWHYLGAISNHLPSLQLSSSYKQEEGSQRQLSSKLSLSQPLYSNELSSQWTLSKIDWQIEKEKLASLENDLRLQVRSTYFDIILYSEEVRVAEENISLLDGALKQEDNRFKLGESTLFHLSQSKVALAKALSQYYAAQRHLKNARGQFLTLLGISAKEGDQLQLKDKEVPIDGIALLQQKLEQFAQRASAELGQINALSWQVMQEKEGALPLHLFKEEEMAPYWERAVAQRPQIRLKRLELWRLQQEVKNRRAAFLPAVSAFAQVDNSNNPSRRSPFEKGYQASTGIHFSWTIFDSLSRQRRLHESGSLVGVAQKELAQGELDAKKQVLERFFAIEQALLSYLSAQESVHLAETSIAQALNRQEWGVITSLEYREATSNLATARRDLIKAGNELICAYYQLRHTCGLDIETKE